MTAPFLSRTALRHALVDYPESAEGVFSRTVERSKALPGLLIALAADESLPEDYRAQLRQRTIGSLEVALKSVLDAAVLIDPCIVTAVLDQREADRDAEQPL